MRIVLPLGIAAITLVVSVALVRRADPTLSPVPVSVVEAASLAPSEETVDEAEMAPAPPAQVEAMGVSPSAAPQSPMAAESVTPPRSPAATPISVAESAPPIPETQEERHIRARTRAVPSDRTSQTTALAEAQTTGSHPERVTPLAMPAPFDAAAWAGDSKYRADYIAVSVPGRVWQTAPPAVDGIALASVGTRYLSARQGDPVALAVKGRPGNPVSWATVEGGVFTESETNALTVVADADGIARAHFVAYAGTTDDCTILAASPRCIGQVAFQVIIVAGRP